MSKASDHGTGYTAVEKKVIGITAFGHALCHFNMLILAGALMALVKDLNSSTAQITSIGTICYFVFGLGAFPAGFLVSWTNAKINLQGFFLLSGLSALAVGLSRGIAGFTVALTALGLFGSMYHVSGMTLITQTIHRRGKALGIHGVAGSAGITLTPFIAGAVLTMADWRMIYFVAAFLGFAGFLVLFLDRSVPAVSSRVDTQDTALFPRHMMTAFGILIVVMMINGLVYRGFLTMLPTYVLQNLTADSSLAGGLISTLILSVGMIGQYAGGHLSDRIPMVRLYLVALLISCPFLFLLGYVQHSGIVVTGLLFSLFHFPQQPIENHLISRWMPSRWIGSGFGVKFTATFGVGAFASGLTGLLAERSSIARVFPWLSGLVMISCILVFILAGFLSRHPVGPESD
ncbi:MFS transporter [bacterium]|nr:MFS transporter [bacterium]